MNLITRNSPYYHLLKYLLFPLKYPVQICVNSVTSVVLALRVLLTEYFFLTSTLQNLAWKWSGGTKPDIFETFVVVRRPSPFNTPNFIFEAGVTKMLPEVITRTKIPDTIEEHIIRPTKGRAKPAHNLFWTCNPLPEESCWSRHCCEAHAVGTSRDKSHGTSNLAPSFFLQFLPAAFFAAYRFASSCAFPIFFLYRIRLFPNQFDTWNTNRPVMSKRIMQKEAEVWWGKSRRASSVNIVPECAVQTNTMRPSSTKIQANSLRML